MYQETTLGTEIIRVTVECGYSEDYILFESNLTRLLNQKFSYYHYGGDIYQSTLDPNTFFIVALYNTSIDNAPQINKELEAYVEEQYEKHFPYVVSRSITTDQDENQLVDRCYHRFL